MGHGLIRISRVNEHVIDIMADHNDVIINQCSWDIDTNCGIITDYQCDTDTKSPTNTPTTAIPTTAVPTTPIPTTPSPISILIKPTESKSTTPSPSIQNEKPI